MYESDNNFSDNILVRAVTLTLDSYDRVFSPKVELLRVTLTVFA